MLLPTSVNLPVHLLSSFSLQAMSPPPVLCCASAQTAFADPWCPAAMGERSGPLAAPCGNCCTQRPAGNLTGEGQRMDWAQDKTEKPSCALFKNNALGLGSIVHCDGVVVSQLWHRAGGKGVPLMCVVLQGQCIALGSAACPSVRRRAFHPFNGTSVLCLLLCHKRIKLLCKNHF